MAAKRSHGKAQKVTIADHQSVLPVSLYVSSIGVENLRKKFCRSDIELEQIKIGLRMDIKFKYLQIIVKIYTLKTIYKYIFLKDNIRLVKKVI